MSNLPSRTSGQMNWGRRASGVSAQARSHGAVIGYCLRLDESLPFVFVHVLRAVANRAAHLQEPRADTLQAPGAHGEP